MFGSRLEEVMSTGFLPPHNRLAVAMSSYFGSVRCVVMMDREAMPDHEQLTEDLAWGFAKLLEEAGGDASTVTRDGGAIGLGACEPAAAQVLASR